VVSRSRQVVQHKICRPPLADTITAIPIAEEKYDFVKGYDQQSTSSIGGDSDSSDGDDEDQAHFNGSKIAWLMQQAFEQIQSLFYISSLLRRPSFKGKYICSANLKARADPWSEDFSLAFYFSVSDREYVFRKVIQWCRLSKGVDNVLHENEEPAHPDQIQARKAFDTELSESVKVICMRLANANTQRREQLRYWFDHPDDNEWRGSVSTQLRPDISVKREPIPTATRASEPQSQPTSSMSKQSFTTVAKSVVFDARSQSTPPHTVYAQSASVERQPNRVPDVSIHPNRVPDVPIPPNATSFLCPYCGMKLISREMENRQTWK
jgi:hypothetical protein